MPEQLFRGHSGGSAPKGLTIACDTTIGNCKAVPFADRAFGGVIIPSGSTITSLEVYVCDEDEDGTYVPLYNDSGAVKVNGAVAVAASRGYALPDECAGHYFLKFISNAAGNITVTPKG